MKQLWLILLLGVGFTAVIPTQALEYWEGESTEMITVTENDRYYGSDNIAHVFFFEDEVNPTNNWTIVNVTVVTLNTSAPLDLEVNYWISNDQGVYRSTDAPSIGSLNPYQLTRPIQEGDRFDFGFEWKVKYTDFAVPPHYLSIELETQDGSPYTGTVTLEVHWSISIDEPIDKSTSVSAGDSVSTSDSNGVEWFVVIVGLIALAGILPRTRID